MILKMIRIIFFSILLLCQGIVAKARPDQLTIHPEWKIPDIPDSLSFETSHIADYLSKNYKSDSCKVKALYLWLTHSIDYDVENKESGVSIQDNAQYIKETLQKRCGLCQAFAETFNEICIQMGITSFVATGIVKTGRNNQLMSHAWNIVNIDSSWRIYDATFGSGYLDHHQYIKKVSLKYCNIHPDSAIRSHYPFDPMWQLRNSPNNISEFLILKNKLEKAPVLFDFRDTLSKYVLLSKMEKALSSFRRINTFLTGVELSKRSKKLISSHVALMNYNYAVDIHNYSLDRYKQLVRLQNVYFKYRQGHFIQWSSNKKCFEKIGKLSEETDKFCLELSTIYSPGEELNQQFDHLRENASKLQKTIREEKAYLEKYSPQLSN